MAFFDESNLDSTLSSTNSTSTNHSFLSVTSSSSTVSSPSSYYQQKFTPSAAPVESSNRSRMNKQMQNSRETTPGSPNSSHSGSIDLSFSYSSNRVDPNYMGSSTYNCYKPTTTQLYSQRKPFASSATSGSSGTTQSSSVKPAPAYDNSSILNHHQQSQPNPSSYNPSHHYSSKGLYKTTSYGSSVSNYSSSSSLSSTYNTPSAITSTSNSLFNMLDNSNQVHHDDNSNFSKGSISYSHLKTNSKIVTDDNLAQKIDNMSISNKQPSTGMASTSSLTFTRQKALPVIDFDLSTQEGRQGLFDQVQIRFICYCHGLSKDHVSFAQRVSYSPEAISSWGEYIATASATSDPRFKLPSIEKTLATLCKVTKDSPSEDLTAQVYVFSIKVFAMNGRSDVYIDLIKYVIETLHDEGGIDPVIVTRVYSLYVLHLLHHDNETVYVFDILGKYFSSDDPIWNVVHMWLEHDYRHWRTEFDSEVDIARRRVMQFGEVRMAKEALVRLRQQQSTEEKDMAKVLGLQWESLLAEMKVAWKRTNSGVIIVE